MTGIDEALDTALNILERGTACREEVELVSTWLVDTLVHVLDEYRLGECSRCDISDYSVVRIGDQIAVMNPEGRILDSEGARRLAAALLRAAEAADDARVLPTM